MALPRVLLLLCCLLSISACAYQVPRYWAARNQMINGHMTGIEPFRSSLKDCVAKNDPEHLHDLDNGGEYQMSGWFFSNDKIPEVEKCMAPKGWFLQSTPLLP